MNVSTRDTNRYPTKSDPRSYEISVRFDRSSNWDANRTESSSKRFKEREKNQSLFSKLLKIIFCLNRKTGTAEEFSARPTSVKLIKTSQAFFHLHFHSHLHFSLRRKPEPISESEYYFRIFYTIISRQWYAVDIEWISVLRHETSKMQLVVSHEIPLSNDVIYLQNHEERRIELTERNPVKAKRVA